MAIGFEIFLNGKKHCTAGPHSHDLGKGSFVLTASVEVLRESDPDNMYSDPHGRYNLSLTVGGLYTCSGEKDVHSNWISMYGLKINDEIEIAVIEASKFDAPEDLETDFDPLVHEGEEMICIDVARNGEHLFMCGRPDLEVLGATVAFATDMVYYSVGGLNGSNQTFNWASVEPTKVGDRFKLQFVKSMWADGPASTGKLSRKQIDKARKMVEDEFEL